MGSDVPKESSPVHILTQISLKSNLFLSSNLCMCLPIVSSFQNFYLNPYMHLSSAHTYYVIHDRLILDLIHPPQKR